MIIIATSSFFAKVQKASCKARRRSFVTDMKGVGVRFGKLVCLQTYPLRFHLDKESNDGGGYNRDMRHPSISAGESAWTTL